MIATARAPSTPARAKRERAHPGRVPGRAGPLCVNIAPAGMPLLLLVLLPALAGRPFPEERLLLDRRLETLRRILPDGPNPPADRALVLEMAQSTGLESLEVQ